MTVKFDRKMAQLVIDIVFDRDTPAAISSLFVAMVHNSPDRDSVGLQSVDELDAGRVMRMYMDTNNIPVLSANLYATYLLQSINEEIGELLANDFGAVVAMRTNWTNRDYNVVRARIDDGNHVIAVEVREGKYMAPWGVNRVTYVGAGLWQCFITRTGRGVLFGTYEEAVAFAATDLIDAYMQA